ncbi:MAG: CorA family divalent cation transporter [Bacteroidota bacterium]
MIRIFYKQGDKIVKDNDVKRLDSLSNIMWVDMQAPTTEEEEWIESKTSISIQTPQEIAEIESSSRYFERNNEITANSNFLRLENGQYEKHAVSFIIKESVLYTFRQADLSTFADVVRKMKANSENFNSGFDVLMSLQETRIDLEADLIERVSNEITVFSRTLSTDRDPNSEFLLDITELQENTMMLRESMIDKQRVLSNLLKSSLFPEDRKVRLRIILKDIQSLVEYSTFNFERLEYLQNTLTGLINLEQNKVLKRFTVFSIAFLPPTLIAGIFGMNFNIIPGANEPLGFAVCIGLMVLSSLAVLFSFKRRGWI